MCGFVGGTDPSWNYEGALAPIAHRGPGLLRGSPLSAGVHRLSILALRLAAHDAGGRRPHFGARACLGNRFDESHARASAFPTCLATSATREQVLRRRFASGVGT